MNRQERRRVKKRLAPIARRIVELENNIKNNINKEASEDEMETIIGGLSMIEMLAIEDYICSKKLLD